MNRSLLIALALPSMMFYQSNAPILYSSEKLIAQVREEQAVLAFDLSETGNTLIVSNDRIEAADEASETNEIVEPEQAQEDSTNDSAETAPAVRTKETEQSKANGNLPKTNKQAAKQSTKKSSRDVLETIEQKISALPFAEPPSDKKGERELVRMLANMSGTILYGTKMTETNKQEYITF
ncbi:hypothetical protein [Enterococcus sp. AZ196]|uniref:hypothetical protein n=1 Tax=Enterococcus sp. AZ196 TaxID=2774659 RepID=UPI003D2AB2EF